MGRVFSCSSHLRLWTIDLRPHLSRYKKSTYLTSCEQACNIENHTALVFIT